MYCFGPVLKFSEKIVVPKNLPYLTIQGGGRWNTLIDHAETNAQAGTDIADATAAISAPNFIARNITFQVRYTSLFVDSEGSKIRLFIVILGAGTLIESNLFPYRTFLLGLNYL